MNSKQKELIRDNLEAFVCNFGSVRIESNYPDRGFYVYFPENSESYIQYCYDINYLNGWLYGVVQGVKRAEFNGHQKEKVVYDINPMTKLPVSFCPGCGEAVNKYAYGRGDLPQVFCPYCGQALDWKEDDGD